MPFAEVLVADVHFVVGGGELPFRGGISFSCFKRPPTFDNNNISMFVINPALCF